jgi:uncharacterized protein (DUF3084 family)
MTTGLVFILAILILGGVIATVGDRLGTRVGKARLTWFNLRPRKTATLITILTGVAIAASTLGILIALDGQLRRALFEFGEIRDDLDQAKENLDKAKRENERIQERLKNSRQRQRRAQRLLGKIDQDLKKSVARQKETQQRLNGAQAQLGQIQSRYQLAQSLLSTVSQQAVSLQSDIQRLQSDRQELIRQRDQVRGQIAERDQQIALRDGQINQRNAQIQQRETQIKQRDQEIAEREAQLKELETQRVSLEQEIEDLRLVRVGNVGLLRNQLLYASPPFRIPKPPPSSNTAIDLVNNMLWQANRAALQRIRPGSNRFDQQVLLITIPQVEQLAQQISDGREYVVRIQAARNYVIGEPCVIAGEQCIAVVATALENQLIFAANSTIANIEIDSPNTSNAELAEKIRQILLAAQFRARQAGILGENIRIANNDAEAVARFFERIRQYNQPVEVRIISPTDIYTSSRADLELVAVQNGQILFGTTR